MEVCWAYTEVFPLSASIWYAERCLPHLWALVSLPVLPSSLRKKSCLMETEQLWEHCKEKTMEWRNHCGGGDGEGVLSGSTVGVLVTNLRVRKWQQLPRKSWATQKEGEIKEAEKKRVWSPATKPAGSKSRRLLWLYSELWFFLSLGYLIKFNAQSVTPSMCFP